MLNRRKVRELLLCAFYSHEVSGTEIDEIIGDIKDYEEWHKQAESEDNFDIILEKLISIYDDIVFKKMGDNSQINFTVPGSNSEISYTIKELLDEKKKDNFYSLAKKVYDENSDLMDKKEKKNSQNKLEENYIFFNDFIVKYKEKKEEADKAILQKLSNWDITRVAAIDKIILRMGIIEIMFFDDIPPKVTINEAIELAKKYSTNKSGLFVNGILNSVMKDSEKA